MECYANIFKVGRVVFTFPYCKDTIGSEIPDYLVRIKYKCMIYRDPQSK